MPKWQSNLDESDPSRIPRFQLIGICHVCIHRTGVYTCDAFPGPHNRIPLQILTGDFLHTKPFPGDHGIQFERKL